MESGLGGGGVCMSFTHREVGGGVGGDGGGCGG